MQLPKDQCLRQNEKSIDSLLNGITYQTNSNFNKLFINIRELSMRQLSGQCTVKAISRQLGCSRFQTRKITAKSCDLKWGGGGGGQNPERLSLIVP